MGLCIRKNISGCYVVSLHRGGVMSTLVWHPSAHFTVITALIEQHTIAPIVPMIVMFLVSPLFDLHCLNYSTGQMQ